MILPSEHEPRGGGLWAVVAGLAAAALLTLGAAIATSMLQQQTADRTGSPQTTIAQK